MGEGELWQCIEKRRPNTSMGEADEKAEEELYQRIKKKRQKRRSKAEQEWFQYIKNKRARRNSISIPLHIIFDIHTRLPVKSLLRFKSACKSWHALICNPLFATSHLDRSKEYSPRKTVVVPVVLGLQKEIRIYTRDVGSQIATLLFTKQLEAPQNKMGRPPHCNGLLLLFTCSQMHVCNPSTGELLTLPKGSPSAHRHRTQEERGGLGFVPSTSQYKVVRHFYRSYDHNARSCSIGFEVLTLGRDNSWRAVTQDPPYPVNTTTPACVGEDIYWKIDNSLHRKAPQAILRFNLREEKFSLVPPPSSAGSPDFSSYERVLLVELEGTLCFAYCPKNVPKVDIWIYKDANSQTWVHSFSIELQCTPKYYVPVSIQQEKLWLKIDGALQYYNHQSKSMELPLVDMSEELIYYNPQREPRYTSPCPLTNFDVLTYVESLVSFEKLRPWS